MTAIPAWNLNFYVTDRRIVISLCCLPRKQKQVSLSSQMCWQCAEISGCYFQTVLNNCERTERPFDRYSEYLSWRKVHHCFEASVRVSSSRCDLWSLCPEFDAFCSEKTSHNVSRWKRLVMFEADRLASLPQIWGNHSRRVDWKRPNYATEATSLLYLPPKWGNRDHPVSD